MTVINPNGQQTSLNSSQVISAIPGTYTVTAAPVVVGSSTYNALLTTQAAIVTAGNTTTATVDYKNVVPATTKILDSVALSSLSVSSDGFTLTMSASSPIAQTLAVGNVIVVPPTSASGAAPMGMLRKVVSINASSSQVVATTQLGTLSEAFQRVAFQIHNHLTTTTIQTVHTAPGVIFRSGASLKRSLNSDLTQNSSQTVSDPCGGYSLGVFDIPEPIQITAVPGLTLSGSVEICSGLNFSVDIVGTGFLNIQPTVNSLTATASMGEYSDLTLQGDLLSGSFDPAPTTLATLSFPPVEVPGLPVWVTPEVSVFVGANGNITSEVSTEVSSAGTFTGGVTYASGTWSPVPLTPSFQFAYQPPTLNASLSAKAYAGVEFDLYVYDVVGPSFKPDGYLDLEANIANDPWWALTGGIEGPMSLDVTFLGENLANYDLGTLFNYSYPIASASGPFSPPPNNPIPTVTSLAPASLTVGSVPQTLTITGTGFLSSSTVTFNGIAHSSDFVSTTKLTIALTSTDLDTVGSYPVVVTNPAPGGGSSTYNFTVGNGGAFQGKVLSGQQAIVGSSVYMYAANTIGYQNTSVSLLTFAGNTSKDNSGNYYVTTDSNGRFTIPGGYTCPNTTSQVYLYAIGGNPGAGVNSAAGLLAALGSCANLSASTSVVVNEVSTVATAYAIAGYATDATHVSSSGTTLAQTGIANAFATASNLETLSTGAALSTTPAGNGTVPQSEINTLANILAACVGSTGPTSTACTALLNNAKNGTVIPTDTATAAINIAHNPGANIAALFALQTANSPFQITLSTAPNDLTIAITYSGGGLANPGDLVIDGAGNVWAENTTSNGISKFSPTGAPLSESGGYTGGGLSLPNAIAIDASGNLWATNSGSPVTISELNNGGSAISGSSGYTGGGLNAPAGIAIGASNNVWVANNGNNSISKFSSSGSPISSTDYTGGGLNGPNWVVVDLSGNVWVNNTGGTCSISKFNSSGSPVSSIAYTGGGLAGSYCLGLAVDGSGNIWASDFNENAISELNSSGTAISGSPYSGGGLSKPDVVAIDGSGNVWVGNQGYSISKFNSSGTAISGPHGYAAAGLVHPNAIAIDGSGNVWAGNYSDESITEFVGAATPVVTPVVANLRSPYGSSAVNKP